jgi:DNA-binding response OmpR family regulator
VKAGCHGKVRLVRILLVEDSERVAQTVQSALKSHGHAVTVAGGVAAAEACFSAERVDLVILDIGLPDGSGLEWCRAARSSGSNVPILALTARSTIQDRVAGLDAGADDYLAKPFAVDELLARVRALGRRGPRWSESQRCYGQLVIDRDRRMVTIGEERVPLTAREFEIVALLAWRDGRVVTRDELLDGVWGDTSEGAAASFDVLVARIRRKLAERGVRDAIRTLRQVGYSWALEASKRG